MLEQEAEEEAAKNEADKENTDSIEDEIDEEARKASARPKSGIMICIFPVHSSFLFPSMHAKRGVGLGSTLIA